ncbi:NADH-quinone oxidoreductase subunit M [Iamia sp. SCSIO 61187]|uniref:complex I subunit 4 family protein n=1 Tax=Iamia sp. SCSIO 61187 TaxID=2722752 RepID=UPI001C637401|nr:NADH-quinone oxidoreductase subunit M [Iamia sp. SCSIO 61187]QYG94294.1 NADH-quinone oxidoreductase subunit M [Iamia sp. SCSIO 61187]
MLTIAIFLPIAAAAVFALLPRRLRSDVGPAADDPWASRLRLIASVVGVVPLVILLGAWARFDGGDRFELVESSEWIPTLGVGYRVGVDGLSLPLALMTALVFAVAIAYPVDLRGRPGPYYALMLFLEGVSVGLFLSLDLFLFFVFWDLSLVGIYFLIGAWGHGDAQRSALKFFVYTFAGSLALLLAILGLYLATEPRTFDMAEIIRQQPLPAGGVYATLVFLGFFVGFGVKTPIVPFHTWLPPAHVDAPGPASAVLAGVLLKMGTYGFVRVLMSMQPETFARFAFPIGVLAVVSIVYGSLVAMAQTNLKRLIAYTSVNHMGYVMLGLSAAGASIAGQEGAQALALTGATLEMVAHGLITGALFLVSGSILTRGKTYEMEEYGGLAGRAPALTGITVVAVFASLGLPGLAGFVAEFQVFAGALAVYPWLAGIGLLGIVITAALFLRMLQQVFLGPLPDRWTAWPDLGWVERLTLGTLVVLIIGIGVAPALLLDVIDTFASPFVGR